MPVVKNRTGDTASGAGVSLEPGFSLVSEAELDALKGAPSTGPLFAEALLVEVQADPRQLGVPVHRMPVPLAVVEAPAIAESAIEAQVIVEPPTKTRARRAREEVVAEPASE